MSARAAHMALLVSGVATLSACGEEPGAPRQARPASGGFDDAAAERCGPAFPEGTCPAGRACVEGGCIVDLDPGHAREEGDRARWSALWRIVDESYGGFPARASLDWARVHDDVDATIAGATTRLAVEWAIARGVARIGDGHTAFTSDYLCELDPGFSDAISNIGACATEIDGALFVYRALPPGAAPTASDTGLVAGDEILAIDGRSFEELLADLDAQPRCAIAASTPAQLRARLVQSVLFRADTDAIITVRHTDGREEDLPLSFAREELACDGRVSVAPDVLAAGGVELARLDGGVAVVHLPQFGSWQGERFVEELVLEGLRTVLEDIAEDPSITGLVLDVRNNPGGFLSVARAIGGWVFDEPTPLFRCRARIGPAHDDHGEPVTHTAQPDAGLTIDVPIVVLTSATSFSAADFTAHFLRQRGRALVLGQPGGGGFGSGEGEPFGRDAIGYSGVLCEDVEGRALDGRPAPVDVYLEYDPQDLTRGHDTLIEAARRALLARTPHE